MLEKERKSLVDLFHQVRSIVILVLGGLLGVFAVQNMANVELTFLFWTFESRRIVVIALSVITGLIIGWFFGYSMGQKNVSR